MNNINISAVSYLNAKPFIYGIQHSGLLQNIHLEQDTPSVCAQKLIDGKVHIGLIPVAVLPDMKEYHIISDHCIGATSPVTSVMLYSKVSMEKIEKILLDHQSRTSVQLMKVLAKKYWKINPQWVDTIHGFEKNIENKTAAVVIGDRALEMNGRYPFQYDLAEAWIKMTGLPFVFACWVTVKKLSPDFISAFNSALELGLSQREKVIAEYSNTHNNAAQKLHTYLYDCISYGLDDRKKQGLGLFMRYLGE